VSLLARWCRNATRSQHPSYQRAGTLRAVLARPSAQAISRLAATRFSSLASTQKSPLKTEQKRFSPFSVLACNSSSRLVRNASLAYLKRFLFTDSVKKAASSAANQSHALCRRALRSRVSSLFSRGFSQVPAAPTSKLDGFKKALKDPRTAKYGKVLFVVGCFGAAALIYKEARPDLAVKIKLEDPPSIAELKEFILKFNAAIKKREPIEAYYKEALKRIFHYRFLANLSPRHNSHPDIALARIGLLTLSECENFDIRYEALKQLKTLLRKPFDPTESIENLLLLEHRIGERLKKLSEVQDSITLLHDQVACYNLILEKIFLGTLQAGSFLSKDTKQEVSQRARLIIKKLEKNPAFQYEAHNAKTLSAHLETPSQRVTETVNALFAFHTLFQEIKQDGRILILESLTSPQGLEKLKQFFSNMPGQYEKAEQIYLRLKENWDEQNVDLYAVIILSKPQWHSSVTDNSLQTLQKTLKATPKDEKNWLVLYRLVEVLSEVVMSKKEDPFRQQAFAEMVTLIDPQTPWQVRYKVATILLQLRNDPLFQELAKEQWQRHLAIPATNLRMEHSLRLFATIQESSKKADHELHMQYEFKGKLKDGVNALQQGLLIPREACLDQLSEQFQVGFSKMPIQVIRGMRGAGKTTLATAYAEHTALDYTLQHWLDAKTLDSDLDALADQVGIPPVDLQTIKTQQDRQLLLKRWLGNKQNHGWLLIIDNVDPEDCIKIKGVLPDSGGHCLLTTYHDTVQNAFLSIPLKLPLFSPFEAVHYLLNKPQYTSEERNSAHQICIELGHLPLALSHARAYVKKTGCSFEHLLNLYRTRNVTLFPGVETTWEINFTTVKATHPLASELLPLLAQLYHRNIPFAIINTWLTDQGNDEATVLATLAELKEFAPVRARSCQEKHGSRRTSLSCLKSYWSNY
jgi:hypothetical protein